MAGENVAIGSRSRERATEVAENVTRTSSGKVTAGTNAEIAEQSDVVIVAVPLDGVESTLSELRSLLREKVVVSVVASIRFVDGRPQPVILESGSVAELVAQLLPESRVASGFHTLSATKLATIEADLDEDTIICADKREVREQVMGLAERIRGLKAVNGGRLAGSCYTEQFVGMLATINRLHKAHAGLRIVDL